MQDNKDIDLTIIGNVKMADGIGQHLPMFLQALHQDLAINALQLPPTSYKEVPREAMQILIKPFNGFGKVAFWTFILGLNEGMIEKHKSIISPIKIAFSVFESSQIPKLWTKILNECYDLVVVPDQYLVNVYYSSGVRIPIFVIPLGIEIENLLEQPIKTKANNIFTFGMTAGYWNRKNHIKLLQAFGKQFGNNSKFKLKLHGRFGSFQSSVEQAVGAANYSNVELLSGPLSSQAYNDWMSSLDCYVFPSQGEGFSITPREAMALGLPTIISNNSVHKTICNTGLVIPLKSNIKVPAKYEIFNNQTIGYYDDCNVSDLANLMQDAFLNYEKHLEKAQERKDWVKQFLWPNLKKTYINLFKPKELVLGKNNLVNEEIFQTSDKKLFNKMKEVFK